VARAEVLVVVREWIAKAESDLITAAHTLKLGARCPTDSVCFHAQQCVEKYLKALLVLERVDFPRTHDLEKLTSLLPVRVRPRFTPSEQAILTDYATAARYPGWGTIPLADAREAVRVARRVRKGIRDLLPKEALRRSTPS
jgi:HEPN domain-containing protein